MIIRTMNDKNFTSEYFEIFYAVPISFFFSKNTDFNSTNVSVVDGINIKPLLDENKLHKGKLFKN